MTTISVTNIDETKPTSGTATTQSVRDNFSEIKAQLTNAGNDIDDLADGTTAHTNFASTGIDDNATTTAITIDSNENIGIGVTPESWLSTQTALQIGGLASFMAESSQAAGSAMQISNNGYRDATSWKYIVTDEATRYVQDDGEHKFFVASSGTADTAISWTAALTIDNTANAGLAGNFTFGANSYGSLLESGGNIYIDNVNTSAITYFRNDNSGGTQKTCIALGGATPNCSFYGDGTLSFSTKASSTYRTINFASIPTSATGLSSGDVYSNAGVLTIV